MGGAVFGINWLAEMGIMMSLHAFDYSTRNPLRSRPFDFSPAFHKTLFYGRQTGPQAKHPKLRVKRLDPSDNFIKIVATTESHWDDNRPEDVIRYQPRVGPLLVS